MNSSFIGKSIKRIDSLSKVTGQALYPGDINLPRQAYLKVVFAEIPHAIIKTLDISKAEQCRRHHLHSHCKGCPK